MCGGVSSVTKSVDVVSDEVVRKVMAGSFCSVMYVVWVGDRGL